VVEVPVSRSREPAIDREKDYLKGCKRKDTKPETGESKKEVFFEKDHIRESE